MSTRRQFRLWRDLRVVEFTTDRKLVRIPHGEVVAITHETIAGDMRFVEIRWREKDFVAFTQDIQSCGDEIQEKEV